MNGVEPFTVYYRTTSRLINLVLARPRI